MTNPINKRHTHTKNMLKGKAYDTKQLIIIF